MQSDDNKITKLWIEPGCITCGSCAYNAPEVFEVTDVSHIKQDAPINECNDKVKKAAALCPVQVIKYLCQKDE